MKNLTTIFAFLFATVTFGQNFAPIQAYRENDYTPSEVKNFALQSTELSSNFRRELVRLANAGLISSGEKVTLTESHIAWILDHTRDSFVVLQSFINSHRKVGGSEITFFNDKGFSGNVGVFTFGKCRVILYKSRCMNLIEIHAEKIPTPAPKQVAPPAEKEPEKKEEAKPAPKPEPCKPCDWEWDCRTGDKIVHHRHPNWMKCCDLVFVGQPCPTVVVVQQRTVCPPRQIQGAYQTRAAYRVGCPPKPCH